MGIEITYKVDMENEITHKVVCFNKADNTHVNTYMNIYLQ